MSLAQQIAAEINDGWYSTQEATFAAIAMNRLYSAFGQGKILASVGDGKIDADGALYSQPVSGEVPVKNLSDGYLSASLVRSWRPGAEEKVAAASNGLALSVAYFTDDGTLSVKEVPQGTEFRVQVKVRNTLPEMQRSIALRVPVPSGWEIINERLRVGADEGDYRDIRDDRVDWFFDLAPNASRTFSMRVRAANEGDYCLPSVAASAMYAPKVYARSASGNTRVVR